MVYFIKINENGAYMNRKEFIESCNILLEKFNLDAAKHHHLSQDINKRVESLEDEEFYNIPSVHNFIVGLFYDHGITPQLKEQPTYTFKKDLIYIITGTLVLLLVFSASYLNLTFSLFAGILLLIIGVNRGVKTQKHLAIVLLLFGLLLINASFYASINYVNVFIFILIIILAIYFFIKRLKYSKPLYKHNLVKDEVLINNFAVQTIVIASLEENIIRIQNNVGSIIIDLRNYNFNDENIILDIQNCMGKCNIVLPEDIKVEQSLTVNRGSLINTLTPYFIAKGTLTLRGDNCLGELVIGLKPKKH